MRRLLLMMMVLVFGVTHAAAAPYALCRHADFEAHAAALQSTDHRVASEAHREEAAEAAADKLGSLADNVSAAMANGVLPEQSHLPRMLGAQSDRWADTEPESLSGRAVTPLLQPPLA